MRSAIYLYNNLHNGDQLFTRPLVRRLADSERFDIVVGAFRNTAYLYEDLVTPHCRLHVSEYDDIGYWAMFDLAVECPAGHAPIDTWLGAYPDTHAHQWHNVVEVANRQLAERGIAFRIEPGEVPMIDFAPRPLAPRLRGKAVYVENGPTRSAHSTFTFDLAEMAGRHPELCFVCTAPPGVPADNVVDASRYDLRDLSGLSEQCLAILGKGSGPFCCTYTTANRSKPRAVCGYRSATSPTFWDYPGSPIRHLDSMSEVLEFLAEHAEAPAR